MRTNIEIDDHLLKAAMRLGKQPTKRAAVQEALQYYVNRLKRQQLLHIRHKSFWKGNLQEMRKA
ncbi:type II toxin-antitoxin system VapB family antitoxin [Compostibacter hankyongensis]|uniref:Type II toxin-antitoxin system VapB family antitoxin n=1 Tax=Compostibacter hankyongensis TaxID=1007089 RepID=A0ABP8FJ35_9BACT